VQVGILRRIVSATVGFSPVPAGAPSSLTGDANTPATGATGDGSLFSQLLALLGSGNGAEGATSDLAGLTGKLLDSAGDTDTPVAPTLSVPAQTDPTAGMPTDLAAIVDAAKQVDTTGGKSLLKSLADALTALNDSLEAGGNPDAKQLESVDDLASVLAGLLAQAQPALAPPTSTGPATNGATITTVDAPGNAGAADLAATLKDLIAALAPSGVGADNGDAEVKAAGSTPAPADTDTMSAAISAATASDAPAADLDPVMAQLAKVLDQVADKLSEKAPALAEKLTALGKTLESTATTPQVLDALGLADDAAAEIADLVQRIAQPKPAKPGSETGAFTPPSLDLPDTPLGASKTTDGTAQAIPSASGQATPTETVPRTDAAATLDAKPVDTRPADRAMDPVTPAKTEAGAAPDRTAAAADAPDTNGLAQQPQAPANIAAPAVARTAQGAYQAQSLVPSFPQVAFEFARHVEAGSKRFQIRLDPPELGRIDVRLSVDNSGVVQARMTVERAETLDMMQRDQRSLQQALQQAGLDMSKTNLEFSLGQNGFGRNGQSFEGWGGAARGRSDGPLAAADAAPAPVEIYRGTASQRGLNLFV
jgi:flagellar hook-length control protein FliK